MMNEKTTLRAHLRALRDSLDGEYISSASRSACERIAQLDEFKSATAILLYFPINNEISPLFLLDVAQKWGKKVAFPTCDHESGTLTFKELPAFHEKNDNTTENNPPLNKSLPRVSEGAEERGGGIVFDHLSPDDKCLPRVSEGAEERGGGIVSDYLSHDNKSLPRVSEGAEARGGGIVTNHLSHDNKSLPRVSEGAEARGGGIVSDYLSPAKFGLFEPNNTCPLLIPDEKTLCIVPAIAFDENGNRLGYGKGFYDRFLRDFKGTSVGLTCSDLLVKQLPTDPHDTPVKIVITESEIIKIPK